MKKVSGPQVVTTSEALESPLPAEIQEASATTHRGCGHCLPAATDGPACAAMSDALAEAFGRPTTTEGQGGSIPLCNVLHKTFPDAEIMLLGVEEPRCLIHAPNESVDPTEIEHMALAEELSLGGPRRRPLGRQPSVVD